MHPLDGLEEAVFHDTDGTAYTLGEQKGSGGQGAVYQVAGRNLAVKITSVASEEEQRRQQLEYVRQLPIEDLPITRPRSLLREHPGYVMDLLARLTPIGDVVRTGDASGIRKWLDQTRCFVWRYRTIANLADLLAKLHSRALIYGDLSLSNVYAGGEASDPDVWLIDPDNLHHDISGFSGRTVYTPGYGAPEAATGQGLSMKSDVFAFAAVAHRVLTLLFPYRGVKVVEGPPEMEEKANRGKLPYVNHPTDTSNAQGAFGLPLSAVLTNRIEKLFQKTFVDGKNDPGARPSIRSFYWAFHEAADYMVKCPSCEKDSFPSSSRTCMWCEGRLPPLAIGVIGRWLPDHPLEDANQSEFLMTKDPSGRRLGKVSLPDSQPLRIPSRITRLRTEGGEDGGLSLAYSADESALLVQRHDDAPYRVRIKRTDGGGSEYSITSEKSRYSVAPGARCQIIFGDGSGPARCLFFRFPQ